MHCKFAFVFMFAVLAAVPAFAQKPTREEKLQQDRAKVEAGGQWIYNDLALGFRTAGETNQPMMVVLRCVPCEECVKLDDDVMDADPIISQLMKDFVRVRQVSTNGLDLRIFQFDTDQSFAVFFLNADGTVYGRFGTRSHRTDWIGDVSMEGLAEAMKGALAIHQNYPANRDSLLGKQGGEPEKLSPEQYPSLQERYDSHWKGGGELVKSCIHCHQIGDAQREFYWRSGQPVPTNIIYQYPHPKTIGLVLDPKDRALVKELVDGSAAERAGLRSGDQLLTLQGQPLLAMADVQWVLHHTPAESAKLSYVAQRGDKQIAGDIELDADWRTTENISWRVSSWGLRRMVTGGLSLEALPQEEREALMIEGEKLPADVMTLRVKHVGQYNEHAAAKRAGFQQGDVLLSYDGQANLNSESKLFAYALQHCQIGQTVNVDFIRDGKRVSLKLPIQP